MAQKSSQNPNIYDNTNSFNVNVVTNRNNVVNVDARISDEDNQIQEWLSPLKPQQRHQDVRSDRLDGVGNWLLETGEFRKWSGGEDGCREQVLLCSGGPGVGKTYLSSLVIDSLCDKAEEKDLAVAWLYCDFRSHQEQSATNMLGAILKQLVSIGEIPENVRRAFRGRFSGRGLRLPDIVGMLKATIALLPQVYICIDALDESIPKSRRELLESLQDIVRESPGARVLFTGRCHVQGEVKKYFPEAIVLLVSPTDDDIRVYVGVRLDRDTLPSAMDDDLRGDIMRIIPEMISEIFLLVSLNIDAILGEVTIYKRRKKLVEMTKGEGLGDAYTSTLTRIKSQNGGKARLGMEALMWISHSERPLKDTELCCALGVERGDTDRNIGNTPAIETVLHCSLGLVTIDSSSSTARLIHFTLQEHLFNTPFLFHSPHSMMAEVCLTFLNFQCIRDLSDTLDSPLVGDPFIGYASCYWGIHARRELSERLGPLALKLLGGFDRHVSSKILLMHERAWWWHRSELESGNTSEGFTGLHCAAYFGLVEMADALLEMREWDLNATDVEGNTAFAWAARKGHEDMVKMLLGRGDVNPDTADANGRTPLLWAAARGQEGVVKMLLERVDVNPNTTNADGLAPLFIAAWKGHEGVVKRLLERTDVIFNTASKYSSTPLSIAAQEGHVGVVKLLLERADVDPNTADEDHDGQTPLFIAAWEGHAEVVKTLLARHDVDPNIADSHSQTPLFIAAWRGDERVVRMLLERADVDFNIASEYGSTPLLVAARESHEGVVKMLLERDGVNPNTANKYGQTPLFRATLGGHEEVVKMLLEREDVNFNTAAENGITPLIIAVSKGHEGVVKMLLERNGVYPNTANNYGHTPLYMAAWKGHERIVKMLLERAEVNPNTPNKYGLTPLFIATREGHREVVRMLLERADLNPNTADESGQTPLFIAALEGHEEVVKVLLERENVDFNAATKYFSTPLSVATQEGHEGVVKVLLEREGVNPNTADEDHDGQTPLFMAAWEGHAEVVKTLLARHDVDPNIADSYSQTPLFIAAWRGDEGVVEMLLERADINFNTASKYGSTPLSIAAQEGYEGVVKMLLDRTDVNPNTPNKSGQTPLFIAACGGHEGVVRILLERVDVNSDTIDLAGETALSQALRNGHDSIVELLSERKNSVPRSGGDISSPRPPHLGQPPSKRIRRF